MTAMEEMLESFRTLGKALGVLGYEIYNTATKAGLSTLIAKELAISVTIAYMSAIFPQSMQSPQAKQPADFSSIFEDILKNLLPAGKAN